MSKRAIVDLLVGGASILPGIGGRLISVSVTLNAGGQADTADFQMDDADGLLVLPQTGASVRVVFGWLGGLILPVFEGTVDEVRSSGGRSGGRVLSVTAKGVDAAGQAKDGQRRHWDDATVETILKDAAAAAGIGSVSVDPTLAGRIVDYFAALDESFLHLGQRLAKLVGGNFRIQGGTAFMARRGATYSVTIPASVGLNLHSWDMRPVLSRARYGRVVAPWYDRAQADWREVVVETGLASPATFVVRPPASTEADAQRQAEAAKETILRDAGGGTIRIEGDPMAVPDALCALAVARFGVDGVYRITSVTHSYSRSGGFVSDLQLAQPQGGAGVDSR